MEGGEKVVERGDTPKMKLKMPIPAEPQRSILRRPQTSINIIAGTFIATKMTYWIELDTRFAFPVNPAI